MIPVHAESEICQFYRQPPVKTRDFSKAITVETIVCVNRLTTSLLLFTRIITRTRDFFVVNSVRDGIPHFYVHATLHARAHILIAIAPWLVGHSGDLSKNG